MPKRPPLLTFSLYILYIASLVNKLRILPVFFLGESGDFFFWATAGRRDVNRGRKAKGYEIQNLDQVWCLKSGTDGNGLRCCWNLARLTGYRQKYWIYCVRTVDLITVKGWLLLKISKTWIYWYENQIFLVCMHCCANQKARDRSLMDRELLYVFIIVI